MPPRRQGVRRSGWGQTIAIIGVLITALGLLAYHVSVRVDDTKKSMGNRITDTTSALQRSIDKTEKHLEKRIDDTRENLGRRIDDVKSEIGGYRLDAQGIQNELQGLRLDRRLQRTDSKDSE